MKRRRKCLRTILTGALVLLGVAAAGATPPDLGGRDLDLATALDLSLKHSPALQGFATADSQAAALARQAGRGPNPELGLEMENFLGSGDYQGLDAAEITLAVAQTFELGGKRARSAEAAGWEGQRIRLEARLAATEVTTGTARAFVLALAAQQELDLAGQLVSLAEQDLIFVERQVRKGAASPVEISRAQVAVSTARLEVLTAQQTLDAARLRLANRWDAATPSFGDLQGILDNVTAPPTWAELEARVLQSPRLQRWQVEQGRLQAEAALAEALGKIDLTASAGLRHYRDTGDNAAVAAVSIGLPFRDRNRDGQAAARYGLDLVETRRRAHIADLREDLVGLLRDLTTAHSRVVTIGETILPAAEEAMTRMEAAHRKGLFNLTDVLAVRRTWFELRRDQFAAAAAGQIAAIEIAGLLDAPAQRPNDTRKDN